MRKTLLDILACPTCGKGSPLTLTASDERDGDVITGTLVCDGCRAEFPVTKGVARFVQSDDDYCKNFGYQWNRWKNLQVDRLGNHSLSEQRFLAHSPWDASWLKGKLILDAGCGAGRFTDVAAKYGARVVAVDISSAIDACRETTAVHGAQLNHVQASIYDLPFRKGVFDGVYCYGVIQHTPDPAKTMLTLPGFLKPGGLLAYDFYERGFWDKIGFIRHALRRFTPDLQPTTNLRMSQAFTAALFPLGSVLARSLLTRSFVGLLPIALVHDKQLTLEQEYAWTLLDTFDWYGPKYEIRQHYRDVMKLLGSTDLEEIRGKHGVVTARAPHAPAVKPAQRSAA